MVFQLSVYFSFVSILNYLFYFSYGNFLLLEEIIISIMYKREAWLKK